ncbi:hypothetical protein GE061_005993 [Apolygus lucorum]|uniref:Uncharacterized protein n=1 Tax=Apolygus lucorum TaxID=248454 RepID=A0A6A4J0M9_APOLU|nr:hypothetical protein GE061_005993 [Apolygus lucorum]
MKNECHVTSRSRRPTEGERGEMKDKDLARKSSSQYAAMEWSYVVFAIAMSSWASAQLEDDDFCVCVDVYKCENGYITDPSIAVNRPSRETPNGGAGLIDPRIKTCEGIQICCPVRGSNPSNPGTRTTPPPVPVPPPGGILLPQKAQLRGCGVRRFPGGSSQHLDLDSRISGSEGVAKNTFYGEVPWMARIIHNRELICGGSLISDQVVLTGAHCVHGKVAEELWIDFGEWDTTTDKEPLAPQRQQGATIVTHPDFNDKNLQHDVALVFLRGSVKPSEVVDTVCTPDGLNAVDVTSCVATGWGKSDIGKRFQLQPILRKVPMPLIDRDSCQAKLRETRLSQYFKLLPGFICAGGVADGDTCKGDGGGPLFCPMKNEPNRMAVVGITAWGIECGKGNPTVFASVPEYMGWISQQLNNEKLYQG